MERKLLNQIITWDQLTGYVLHVVPLKEMKLSNAGKKNVKMIDFYCGLVAGEFFDINEWNRRFEYACKVDMSDEDFDKFVSDLESDIPCHEQCKKCIDIVLDQQNKTRKLIKRK